MLASPLFVTATLQARGSKFLAHIGVQKGALLCSESRVPRSTPVSCPGLRRAEIIVGRLNWAFISLVYCIVNMETAGCSDTLVPACQSVCCTRVLRHLYIAVVHVADMYIALGTVVVQ